MAQREPISVSSIFRLAALLFATFTLGHIIGAGKATRQGLLVGYGCEGAAGLIYAREESDFPVCREIHREVY